MKLSTMINNRLFVCRWKCASCGKSGKTKPIGGGGGRAMIAAHAMHKGCDGLLRTTLDEIKEK